MGTYSPGPAEATECTPCPEGQTSIVGAASCYTPCQSYEALDTSTMTCTRISANIASTLEGDLGLSLEDASVFLVSDASKVDNVLGTATPGETLVLALSGEAFAAASEYTISDTNVVLIGGSTAARRRRRRLAHTRAHSADATVFTAAPGQRHFRLSGNSTLVLDNIVLQGETTEVSARHGTGGHSSGGVVLDGPDATAVFIMTSFLDCRAPAGEFGGALVLLNGASATVDKGSVFLGNVATQGGAMYVGAGSTLTLGPDAIVEDNMALDGSDCGAGMLIEGGTLALGSNVTWGEAGSAVAATDANILCAAAGAASTIDCGGGRCSGAWRIPRACPLCSEVSGASGCSHCPIGTYGGKAAGLGCKMCPRGMTTHQTGCTSPADCVLMAEPTTLSPTNFGETRPPTPVPTSMLTLVPGPPTPTPTRQPTKYPWPNYTRRPTVQPRTPSPTPRMGKPRRFVRLLLRLGGRREQQVRGVEAFTSCVYIYMYVYARAVPVQTCSLAHHNTTHTHKTPTTPNTAKRHRRH